MTRISPSALSNLRVRHLQLVETLVELGSLHKAAKKQHMSQPSASAMLREVERACGTTLFDRTRQGVTLTREGVVAVSRLRAILSEIDMLAQELQSSPSVPVLRIGATSQTFVGVLQRVLTAFLTRMDCQLDLISGNASVLLNHLEQDQVDCIIGRMPADWIESIGNREFFYQPLYEAEFCIACAPSHPLARVRKLTLEHLGNVSWILPRKGSYIRYVLTTAFASARLPPPKVQIETGVFLGLLLLPGTRCLTVADRDPLLIQQRLGQAKILPIGLPQLQPPVAFAARRSAMMNPHISIFWEELTKAAARKTLVKN